MQGTTQRQRTDSAPRCSHRRQLIALCPLGLLLSGGCPFDTFPPPGPDVGAITTVLKYAYGSSGAARKVIFLASDEEGTTVELVDEAAKRVEDELGVRVLPASLADRSSLTLPALTPVDPDTGEPGVEIRLGRFRVDEAGRLLVPVGVTLSGLNARGFEYTLERRGDRWIIIDVRETWVA